MANKSTGIQRAKRAIRLCEKNRAESLDLSDMGLRVLPPGVGRLTFLKILNLSDNKLNQLPDEIANLNNLTTLWLSKNDLGVIPKVVLDLPELKQLYINYNDISEIPEDIKRLSKLEVFFVEFNNITEIPSAIGVLTSVNTITFAGNHLSDLPKEMANLVNLQTLDLSRNHFRIVPDAVIAITSLENLYLSSNELVSLPTSLRRLRKLQSLYFRDNPLPDVYFDTMEQGLGALLTLLESLHGVTERLFEAKLLITGEGQVGKSWALAKLRGKDPRSEIGSDNTTWGIDRGELKLPHPLEEDEEILLNTWDFGGQKIYRVTHQFFFSEQAIYILVWNPRQGVEQCRVREWLRMIALRTGSEAPASGASGELAQPRAKVIMVATHAQSGGGSYMPDYGRSSLDRDLREMIVDEIAIDSDTDYGIEELRAKIARHAASLPNMGQPFNARWAAAREAVLAIRAKKPWIDFDEFRTICSAHGVADQDQLRTLAWTYLHSLGRAIWYGSVMQEDATFDDPLLADTIVLDAVWLSRAFVQVLDDEVTQKAGGMLDHGRLPQIWTDHSRAGWHRYKPSEYEILKLVMRRFDVALPTRESEGRRSLVPQLVPYQRPILPWTTDAGATGARTIRLTCELGYEATGLMARLIAATEPWHVYEGGVGLFWEEGAFLNETASFDNQALITVRGTEKPSIHVTVSGDQPAFLMNELYKVIESVLSFWRGMTRHYFVKCPKREGEEYCSGDFAYEAILRRLNRGIDQAFSCQRCDSLWTAEQLILGFEALELSNTYILNHLYRRDQLPCPRMFLLQPAEKKLLRVTSWASFVGERFNLTLLSELSGQKVASQEFSFTQEWVKWVAPMTRVASLALAGAALPIVGDMATEFKEGAAFLDKLGALPGARESIELVDSERDGKNLHIPTAQLAKFARFLTAIGLDPREHGMDIIQAPDGRWLWMNAQEVELYTPQRLAGLEAGSAPSQRSPAK
ncbi:MAG TPA: COR domain-containing protein [Allosphingosinicella sp.]|nr:COR domain-containing protein [Allosphingosinicella sp.]